MNIESKIKELTEKLNQYAYEYYTLDEPSVETVSTIDSIKNW